MNRLKIWQTLGSLLCLVAVGFYAINSSASSEKAKESATNKVLNLTEADLIKQKQDLLLKLETRLASLETKLESQTQLLTRIEAAVANSGQPTALQEATVDTIIEEPEKQPIQSPASTGVNFPTTPTRRGFFRR